MCGAYMPPGTGNGAAGTGAWFVALRIVSGSKMTRCRRSTRRMAVGHAHVERVELCLRPAGHERERLVHDLVAEHATAAAKAHGDRAHRGRVAILDVVGVGEEVAERRHRGRCEAPGVEIGERTAEVGIPTRAEQQIEHPARRAVLADLLGERVLMEVDDDEDAAPLAER